MCGIVGIYFKKKNLHNQLGKYLSGMLDNMSSRGPDSAGFAVYNNESKNFFKYSLCINDKSVSKKFQNEIKLKFKDVKIKTASDHLVIQNSFQSNTVISFIQKNYNDILIVGYGKKIEVFKQVGNPREIVKKFNLETLSGSHGIGHTRMATESAITIDGSHPYSTGEDECLVHTGSLSNHDNLRRELIKNGKTFY